LNPEVVSDAKVVTMKDQKDTVDSKITHALDVTDLTIIAQACSDLPSFHRNELDLEQRLNNRILDLRRAGSGAILKLHSGVCQLIVEFLGSNGFHWIHAPRIISHTVAGDKEYFHLPYFGSDAWLAQNSLYQNQMTLSTDMQRVFDIGPAFRAEAKSRTSSRHLTEVGDLHSYSIFPLRHYTSLLRAAANLFTLKFTVLGTGMTFQEDYHEVVDMMDSMLLFVFKGLQERNQYRTLIETVKKHYPAAREFRVGLDEHGKVPRITFMQAKHLLREELGLNADDCQDFTYVPTPFSPF
jgi:aspartyl-tRNA synthetase